MDAHTRTLTQTQTDTHTHTHTLEHNTHTHTHTQVTPAACHGDETTSTLNFAQRAKSITCTTSVNEILDDQATIRFEPPLCEVCSE